jgi:alcohol dehydrogenase
MKALVYHGPGKKALEDRPIPKIKDAADAIVKVTHTTIRGADLHILTGGVPACAPGRISDMRASRSHFAVAPV